MPLYGEGFAAVYDREWAFWAEHLWPFLAARVGDGRGGTRSWLDLCCGGGHLLGRICAAGYRAVGLDLSPHQLAVARRNAPQAALMQADVRAFEFRGGFEAITCVFDSLNYLTEPADLAAVFCRVARHLAPTGRFVFDLNTHEGLQDAWNRIGTVPCEQGHVTIASSFDADSGLGRAVISGYAAENEASPLFVEEHIERGYGPTEVAEMLTCAGLTSEVLDGHSLQAPEPRSARLLWVCRRTSAAMAS
ncbi:MAG: class I SAM-dependent methyltransferase [Armatimonadetes bacterium]|nr:class I SAM-dependent methyltransferase [Armatimonadota bacterium]